MKQICRNCHFLSKATRENGSGRVLCFSLDESDRTDPDGIQEHYSLQCQMGVWDEGVGPHAQSRTATISGTNREGTCFFWPYTPDMLFQAARELQKREQEYQQVKRSNLYTRIALWIAAGGLLINAVADLWR